jgi:hypothetical protein
LKGSASGNTVRTNDEDRAQGADTERYPVDLRLQLAPSMTLSQIYQIAVFESHVYVISFTHADLPVGNVVQASLDSLCPKIGT